MSKIYKTKRWRIKREKILKRDGYMCCECKRYGNRADADTVHHIYPVDIYPEHGHSDWNLISLCSKCHNKMHDRVTNELTEIGKSLKARVSPPQTKSRAGSLKTDGGNSFQL